MLFRSVTSAPIFPIRGVKIQLKAMGQIYEIVSIQPAEPPSGGKGSNWFRYVIALEGKNTITGYRQGGLKAVTSGLVEMIAQLNERHWNKRGRTDHVPQKKT